MKNVFDRKDVRAVLAVLALFVLIVLVASNIAALTAATVFVATKVGTAVLAFGALLSPLKLLPLLTSAAL